MQLCSATHFSNNNPIRQIICGVSQRQRPPPSPHCNNLRLGCSLLLSVNLLELTTSQYVKNCQNCQILDKTQFQLEIIYESCAYPPQISTGWVSIFFASLGLHKPSPRIHSSSGEQIVYKRLLRNVRIRGSTAAAALFTFRLRHNTSPSPTSSSSVSVSAS